MFTKVAKPGAQDYTNTNPIGKQQYDQSDLIYDDPNIFYDGVDIQAWTDIAKPVGGYDIPWSEMDMPWSDANNSWSGDNPWINVNKPT